MEVLVVHACFDIQTDSSKLKFCLIMIHSSK